MQAEGKVDNYTELATIGPYPSKRAPEESVQYADVIPSNVSYKHTHTHAHTYTHLHTCTYTHSV